QLRVGRRGSHRLFSPVRSRRAENAPGTAGVPRRISRLKGRAGYAISAKMDGNLKAARHLPCGGWRNVAEGGSPNSDLYTTAKRPSSQNPNLVAIADTVAAAGSASRNARLARCIRRNSRNRIGPMPICSWQHLRNDRSDTPI